MTAAGSSWQFTRGPAGVRLMLAAAGERGLGAEDCLRGTGLAPADVASGELPVEAGQELKVARNLRALVDDPALGVEIGRQATVAAFGVWGYAILTSPTAADALAVALRYMQLSPAFVTVDPRFEDGELRIVLGDEAIPPDVRDLLAARDIATVLMLIRGILGAEAETLTGRIETRFDGPVARALRELLPPGAQFLSGRPEHVLAIRSELLGRALPAADPETRRACEAECARLLDRRAHRTGVAGRVRARLLEDPSPRTTMAVLAAELHMDVRTLRRRLAVEGTSFRALRDEVTLTLATELLATVGLSVTEVADRLGYADPTSFTHVFTRLAGHPPSAARRAD